MALEGACSFGGSMGWDWGGETFLFTSLQERAWGPTGVSGEPGWLILVACLGRES